MILFVAIVLFSFTWRLIRRAIVKCLHLVFKLTGLMRLYEHVRSKRASGRRWTLTSWCGGFNGFGQTDSSWWQRRPVSLFVSGPAELAYEKLVGDDTNDHLHQNGANVQATTRRPIKRGHLRRPSLSSFGRSLALPMGASWCNLNGSKFSFKLSQPPIKRPSGYSSKRKTIGNGFQVISNSGCPTRADHLHLA